MGCDGLLMFLLVKEMTCTCTCKLISIYTHSEACLIIHTWLNIMSLVLSIIYKDGDLEFKTTTGRCNGYLNIYENI